MATARASEAESRSWDPAIPPGLPRRLRLPHWFGGLCDHTRLLQRLRVPGWGGSVSAAVAEGSASARAESRCRGSAGLCTASRWTRPHARQGSQPGRRWHDHNHPRELQLPLKDDCAGLERALPGVGEMPICGGLRLRQAEGRPKIGRASCRERV